MIDPYVEVSIHVPDWTHSPFLPEKPPMYSPPVSGGTTTGAAASSSRTIAYKTGVVKNNGFNPVWEERLSLPFDCVGDMLDLVFVRFAVMDEHGVDVEPLAVYCVSLGSIQQGKLLLQSSSWLSISQRTVLQVIDIFHCMTRSCLNICSRPYSCRLAFVMRRRRVCKSSD